MTDSHPPDLHPSPAPPPTATQQLPFGLATTAGLRAQAASRRADCQGQRDRQGCGPTHAGARHQGEARSRQGAGGRCGRRTTQQLAASKPCGSTMVVLPQTHTAPSTSHPPADHRRAQARRHRERPPAGRARRGRGAAALRARDGARGPGRESLEDRHLQRAARGHEGE